VIGRIARRCLTTACSGRRCAPPLMLNVRQSKKWTRCTCERRLIFSQRTAEEAKVPFYLVVNLAVGGGWPIDEAASPSYLYVDRVRVYVPQP